MSVPFSKTLQSLKADDSRFWVLGAAFLVLMLTAWGVWLVFGRVSVYAVSESGRVETTGAVRPIQSLYTGRITSNHIVLGQKVRQGDLLIELDSNTQHFQLLEEKTQSDPLESESEALKREIRSEERALREEQRASEIGIQEAEARLREAAAALEFSELELERKTQLKASGLVSEMEFAQARTAVQRQRAVADGFRLASQRQLREQETRSTDRRSRIEALKRDVVALSRQISRTSVTINRLESEMQVRSIVASADGVVGEIGDLEVGAVITAGETLGSIIPSGDATVVGWFSPEDTLGRIHAGQRARLRLAGFPWTQYGTVSATVANVANEVRDGHVRVELEPDHDGRLSLQHGLPGAVEVEVERISPGAMLLRLAGQKLAPGKAHVHAASELQR